MATKKKKKKKISFKGITKFDISKLVGSIILILGIVYVLTIMIWAGVNTGNGTFGDVTYFQALRQSSTWDIGNYIDGTFGFVGNL